MAAAAWSWVEKMLQEVQVTSAPRDVRVSIRTAVWMAAIELAELDAYGRSNSKRIHINGSACRFEYHGSNGRPRKIGYIKQVGTTYSCEDIQQCGHPSEAGPLRTSCGSP